MKKLIFIALYIVLALNTNVFAYDTINNSQNSLSQNEISPREPAPAVSKVWIDRIYTDYKGDTIVITGQYGYGNASAYVNGKSCKQFASDPIFLDDNSSADGWYYYWDCGDVKSGLFEFSVRPYNNPSNPYVAFRKFDIE